MYVEKEYWVKAERGNVALILKLSVHNEDCGRPSLMAVELVLKMNNIHGCPGFIITKLYGHLIHISRSVIVTHNFWSLTAILIVDF